MSSFFQFIILIIINFSFFLQDLRNKIELKKIKKIKFRIIKVSFYPFDPMKELIYLQSEHKNK